MLDDVDTTIQRTRRYWYEDGLTEIAAGAIFLAISLLFAIEASAPKGSKLAGISALGLPIIVLVGYWIAGRVVRALKARITYPRTGYVAYRQAPARRKWLAAVLGALIAVGLVAIVVVSGPVSRQWIPMMDGLACAAFLAYLAYSFDLDRFWLLAVAAIALGFGASRMTSNEIAGSAIFFGTMAIALVLSGAVTLYRYLRSTSPAAGTGLHDHEEDADPAPAPERATS
jgi:hypothetical protein